MTAKLYGDGENEFTETTSKVVQTQEQKEPSALEIKVNIPTKYLLIGSLAVLGVVALTMGSSSSQRRLGSDYPQEAYGPPQEWGPEAGYEEQGPEQGRRRLGLSSWGRGGHAQGNCVKKKKGWGRSIARGVFGHSFGQKLANFGHTCSSDRECVSDRRNPCYGHCHCDKWGINECKCVKSGGMMGGMMNMMGMGGGYGQGRAHGGGYGGGQHGGGMYGAGGSQSGYFRRRMGEEDWGEEGFDDEGFEGQMNFAEMEGRRSLKTDDPVQPDPEAGQEQNDRK